MLNCFINYKSVVCVLCGSLQLYFCHISWCQWRRWPLAKLRRKQRQISSRYNEEWLLNSSGSRGGAWVPLIFRTNWGPYLRVWKTGPSLTQVIFSHALSRDKSGLSGCKPKLCDLSQSRHRKVRVRIASLKQSQRKTWHNLNMANTMASSPNSIHYYR